MHRLTTPLSHTPNLCLQHSQQIELDAELSLFEGAAQLHHQASVVRNCGQRVVESEHLILLVVAVHTVHLQECGCEV